MITMLVCRASVLELEDGMEQYDCGKGGITIETILVFKICSSWAVS